MRTLFALFTAKRLTVWGAGLLVLGWGLHIYTMTSSGLIDRDGRFKGSDYVQFYVMGSLVLEGRTDALYDSTAHVAQAKRLIHPDLGLFASHVNYGPQVALAFAPLASLPYPRSLAIFLALSGVAYGLSVWLVWRCCGRLAGHGAVVAIIAVASPLFLTVVRYGQLSAFSLLFWAMAVAAYTNGRWFVAGLAIGGLAFKPQLGIVIGVALLASREWRVVAGAVTGAAAQLLIGCVVGGSAGMAEYASILWTLALNPGLVQIYPSEVHSVRGFVQLLAPGSSLVTWGSLVALVAALWLTVRTWRGPLAIPVQFGVIVLLTILASPHLLAYDLLLLTVPLLAFADWIIAHRDDSRRMAVAFMLVGLYFAPFSGNLARAIHVQLSVLVMALIVWRMVSASSESSPRRPMPSR